MALAARAGRRSDPDRLRGARRRDGRAGACRGVVTERGRIRCNVGGRWRAGRGRGLFVGDLGLRLPQLKVRASVVRTAPLDGAPETALWCKDVAFRKRLDGGYTIADGCANVAPTSSRTASASSTTSCRR